MAFKIYKLFKKFHGEGVIPPDSLGDRRLGPPHLLRSYRLQGRHHAPATQHDEWIACAYCQIWLDERLAWNESEFKNITDIRVDAENVWVPDIVLLNKWVYSLDFFICNLQSTPCLRKTVPTFFCFMCVRYELISIKIGRTVPEETLNKTVSTWPKVCACTTLENVKCQIEPSAQ